MELHNAQACAKAELAIRDTLDIVGGKWKLVLISVLRHGKKGFNELSRDAGISPRILSKELQELEINGLVNRQVQHTKPITVQYELTAYSETLDEVLTAMEKWGKQHRLRVISNSKS
jgi:DNA-binding HxlR family transcriptional regulator